MSSPLFADRVAVARRIASAPHLLLFLDFDGTLASIVDHQAMAALAPPMQHLLGTLARHDNVSLIVLSGRNRNDLQSRVGIPGLIYGGNHGLEISGPGFFFVEPAAAAASDRLQDLSTDLAARLKAIPGVLVEPKGLTTSVHYRLVSPADNDEVRRIVHVVLAGAHHLFQLTGGDMVYEIRPRVNWNKGAAAGRIREHLGKKDALAIYVGDDVTDEDAFAALADGITIKVGVTPETTARYHLDRQEDVQTFLEWLATLLSASLT